jgi:hypothetical protein
MLLNLMVGAEGFEPPTLCSQSRCATRLRYAPTVLSPALSDCIANQIVAGDMRHTPSPIIGFNDTIESRYGGYSSAAERLTVAQDVVGSIPTSRPNGSKRLRA